MKLRASSTTFVAVLFATGAFLPSGAYAASVRTAEPAMTAAAQDNSRTNIAGSWALSFTAPDGNVRQATLTIQQSGSSLSGKFQGARGTGALTGTVEGTQVSISINAHGRGISFKGSVDGNKMSGKDAKGDGWSATKQ